MSEPDPDTVLEFAVEWLEGRLTGTPALRALVAPWLRSRLGRLRHPGFVPIFALPRWVLAAGGSHLESRWDADVTYSTLCGYLFIRLVDDIVDEQNNDAQRAALALGIFHNEFQRPYREYFGASHDFWQRFDADWAWSLDMTARDLEGNVSDREQFERTGAAKLGAIRIPVQAACYLADRAARLDDSIALCDAVSRLYQFADDVTDWQADLAAGRNSWLLSEAHARRADGETAGAWMLREGYLWSSARLDEWAAEAAAAADAVGSVAAREHVLDFRRGFARKLEELEPALAGLAALAAAFDSA